VEERPSKAANEAGNVLEAALEHEVYREICGKESMLEVGAEARLEAGLEDGLESSCWIEGRIKGNRKWIKA
jgi:hypothetical protein